MTHVKPCKNQSGTLWTFIYQFSSKNPICTKLSGSLLLPTLFCSPNRLCRGLRWWWGLKTNFKKFLKCIFVQEGSSETRVDHGWFEIKTFPIYAPPYRTVKKISALRENYTIPDLIRFLDPGLDHLQNQTKYSPMNCFFFEGGLHIPAQGSPMVQGAPFVFNLLFTK